MRLFKRKKDLPEDFNFVEEFKKENNKMIKGNYLSMGTLVVLFLLNIVIQRDTIINKLFMTPIVEWDTITTIFVIMTLNIPFLFIERHRYHKNFDFGQTTLLLMKSYLNMRNPQTLGQKITLGIHISLVLASVVFSIMQGESKLLLIFILCVPTFFIVIYYEKRKRKPMRDYAKKIIKELEEE
ncbi:hypothetical protein K5X82_10085 [Halosquirtibacter xylanolyticus]|uniref:hypothetical protein n=1 Tax=Halosquirtibacter xylanolyticus TaxID=3374599 RepID=UPI003748BCC9|nr:hypothetical protein K5X82_10085 [Prolixibacteraceae bacterium]